MTPPLMDAKHIARYLGAMSIEERVQIIKALLEAGNDGLQMTEIAVKTELGAAAVFKQLESLAGLELVFVKSVDNNKVYFANTQLIDELFDCMYHHYGTGFHANREDSAVAPVDADTSQAAS